MNIKTWTYKNYWITKTYVNFVINDGIHWNINKLYFQATSKSARTVEQWIKTKSTNWRIRNHIMVRRFSFNFFCLSTTRLRQTSAVSVNFIVSVLHLRSIRRDYRKIHWGPSSPVIQSYGRQTCIYGRFLFHLWYGRFLIWISNFIFKCGTFWGDMVDIYLSHTTVILYHILSFTYHIL